VRSYQQRAFRFAEHNDGDGLKITCRRAFAAAGGLMVYDVRENYRQAATFVDRILKGEKPSEIPVQFPTKFNLVINLKTAKAPRSDSAPLLLATTDE